MKVTKFEEFNVSTLANVNDIIDHINTVLSSVDLESCRTYVCQDSKRNGKLLYSPIELNYKINTEFVKDSWKTQLKCPKIKGSKQDIDLFCQLSLDEKAKSKAKKTYSQIDFYKDMVVGNKSIKTGLEVQLGKYAFMTSDNLFKFPLFIKNGYIELGISVCLPKKIVKEMSQGIGDYEKSIIEVSYVSPNYPLLILAIE